MAPYDNTYSRVVAWLKIILPLLALGMLSILFLVARKIDPAQTIPYADVDIQELTREQRISQPNYSGVTGGGAAITVSAAKAKPDLTDPRRITGTDIRVGIDLPSGDRIDVVAATAMLNVADRTASLQGGVVLTSSSGYKVTTEDLTLDMDTTQVTSSSGITASAPFGTLTAGQFSMTGDGAEDRPYQLVFKNKVRLIYVPQD